MNVGHLLLMMQAAATPAVQEMNVPVATFSAPNRAFTCAIQGLPTVGIDYERGRGVVDYNDVGAPIDFVTINSVKSVRMVTSANSRTWEIDAQGPAQSEGKSMGYDAKLHIVISVTGENSWSADWTVEAGSYRRSEVGCGPIPPRPRRIELAQ